MVSFSTSVKLSVDITFSEERLYSLPVFFIICYVAWVQITIIIRLRFSEKIRRYIPLFLYATLAGRGQVVGPTGLWPDRSLVRQVVGPTGRWSDRSLVYTWSTHKYIFIVGIEFIVNTGLK